MAVEIEAKMKVTNLDQVRTKLTELGAKHIGDFFEVNTFFDKEDRSLLASDQGLRLRVNRNEVTKDSDFVITYKGPRMQGVLKSREELEVGVTNAKAAENLLIALGFLKMLAFEKRRQKWSFNGCSVELDELPHLGFYVEIEGPDEKRVMAVRESLGMTRTPLIKSSYIAMLNSHLQERGNTNRVVSFSDSSL